jgi:hydrogenase maturation protein HypF
VLAARFLAAMTAVGVEQCRAARAASGISRVVLSGGVFQNRRLLAALPAALEENGFNVFIPGRVSVNDEGIAFGQAAIAAHSAF